MYIRLNALVFVKYTFEGSAELGKIRTEVKRLGIPYLTVIGSNIHRYASGEWVDRNSSDLRKMLAASS